MPRWLNPGCSVAEEDNTSCSTSGTIMTTAAAARSRHLDLKQPHRQGPRASPLPPEMARAIGALRMPRAGLAERSRRNRACRLESRRVTQLAENALVLTRWSHVARHLPTEAFCVRWKVPRRSEDTGGRRKTAAHAKAGPFNFAQCNFEPRCDRGQPFTMQHPAPRPPGPISPPT